MQREQTAAEDSGKQGNNFEMIHIWSVWSDMVMGKPWNIFL